MYLFYSTDSHLSRQPSDSRCAVIKEITFLSLCDARM